MNKYFSRNGKLYKTYNKNGVFMKLNCAISNIFCLECFLNDPCKLNGSRAILGPVFIQFSEIAYS